jgi:hypothetical protein
MPSVFPGETFKVPVTLASETRLSCICLDDELEDATIDSLSLDKQNVFVCLDTALDYSQKVSLAMQCLLKVIQSAHREQGRLVLWHHQGIIRPTTARRTTDVLWNNIEAEDPLAPCYLCRECVGIRSGILADVAEPSRLLHSA